MILTRDFIYIHLPKTGGTFVTKVLSDLYKESFVDYNNPPKKRGRPHKHCTISEIPRKYKGLPIVTCVRNPYDRYVSQYEFDWWRRHPIRPIEELQKEYPNFLEFSFEEYVHFANKHFTSYTNDNFSEEDRLAWHTEQFYRFYCADPQKKFSRIDAEYIEKEDFRKDFEGIHFLRTGSLNQDLYETLKKFGFGEDELGPILGLDKIFPPVGGRSEEQKWEKYYSDELKNYIRHHERIIFKLFPEFDV